MINWFFGFSSQSARNHFGDAKVSTGIGKRMVRAEDSGGLVKNLKHF